MKSRPGDLFGMTVFVKRLCLVLFKKKRILVIVVIWMFRSLIFLIICVWSTCKIFVSVIGNNNSTCVRNLFVHEIHYLYFFLFFFLFFSFFFSFSFFFFSLFFSILHAIVIWMVRFSPLCFCCCLFCCEELTIYLFYGLLFIGISVSKRRHFVY